MKAIIKAIVIDDEPWMLRHFSDECESLHEIELLGSFRNPYAALEFAQNNKIDLVFVDMEMPQLNGAETAKKLCQILPEVKIIIVTAYDESYTREMPECQAYGYLRKPYKSDELRIAINKVFAK